VDQLQSREMILKLFVFSSMKIYFPWRKICLPWRMLAPKIEIVSLSRGLLLAERTDPIQGLRTMYGCIVSTLRWQASLVRVGFVRAQEKWTTLFLKASDSDCKEILLWKHTPISKFICRCSSSRVSANLEISNCDRSC
jgi:hypothetical protein